MIGMNERSGDKPCVAAYFLRVPLIVRIVAVLAVVSACVATAAEGTERALAVPRGSLAEQTRTHPYLFVNPSLTGNILRKAEDLEAIDRYVAAMYHRNTSNPLDVASIRRETEVLIDENHLEIERFRTYSMYIGINSYFNENRLSTAYGRQYIQAILDQPVDFPRGVVTGRYPHGMEAHDGPPRGKLFALGALYDWLHADLDDNIKRAMRERILELLDYIETTWRFYSEPLYSGGHSRLAHVHALVALLAIRDEIPSDEAGRRDRYQHYFDLIVRNWTQGYNPLQDWISIDGGYHMGWAYGTSYTCITPYLAWEFATDEPSWFGDAQRNRVYWYLYGLRHDKTQSSHRSMGYYDPYPFSGDVWAAVYTNDFQGLGVLACALLFDNPHAKWLFNRLDDSSVSYWELLYRHFDEDEGDAPSELPLSRHFRQAGYVIMRDSWDFSENVLVTFKSTSFFSVNHHHRDQNAFTIFYKGPLAIDSGAYGACGGYGSEHWWNYYTRSVAHNTILVYDPDERFTLWDRTYSNDGGQLLVVGKTNPQTLDDVCEGGTNHLIGIDCFEDHGDYTYVRGDATRSYSPHKMDRFTRSLVYLRAHSYVWPVILVYDDAQTTSPRFRTTYLLHSIREPAVENNRVTITIDDGANAANESRLFQETLLPSDAQIVKIGGAENGQAFFVADDGFGNPYNYDDQVNSGSTEYQRALREAGQWRVEVSARVQQRQSRFLNVLSVTDGADQYHPAQATYVGSTGVEGCVVQDNDGIQKTLVLFARQDGPLDEEIALFGVPSFNRLLVVGLPGEQEYNVHVADSALHLVQRQGGPFRSSRQGTLYFRVPALPSSVHME